MAAMAMIIRTAFCLSFIAASVLAGPPGVEGRVHYRITGRDHAPLYSVATITSGDRASGSETYLIESTTGQRIVIAIRKDFARHLIIADYTVNDAKPVRVTLQLPGKASTRSETESEYREHPELRDQDVAVTLEGGGRVLNTSEKEWNAAGAGVRDKAKSIVSPDFAAAMKPLSGVLGFPPFGGACSSYPFVADGAKCGRSLSLMLANVRPDCDFDARFGKPCLGK
jgi:hypothetical protein